MSVIPDVEIKPVTVSADNRGRFSEILRASSAPLKLVQANHSRSRAGVVRGLHFHRRQADLWYVVTGRIRVGLVDLRVPGGPPQAHTVDLDGDDPATLYVPPGVAHGFAALTDVDLIYWVSEEYDASDEFGIAWDDPTLGIDWGVTDPVLSERDRSNPQLVWDDIPRF